MGLGLVGAFIATGEPLPQTPHWVPPAIALSSMVIFGIGYALKSRATRVPYLNWR